MKSIEQYESAARFPIPFTLDEFREDVVSLCFVHLHGAMAVANAAAALRQAGLGERQIDVVSRKVIEQPADMGLTFQMVADWQLVRSLIAMYRFGFLGQRDASVEELGPGGYHIVVAALVRDLARSSFLRFLQHTGASRAEQCVARCLQTVELANARLTLEGLPRFFNFDAKDDNLDLDALINGGDADLPQGGYGAALTVHQMALLSGLEEQSIRTFANPSRPNSIATTQCKGRVVVRIEDAKPWLIARQRYVPLVAPVDGAELELANRPFSSLHELETLVIARLTRRQTGASLDVLRDLVGQHADLAVEQTNVGRAWMTNSACVHAVAELVGLQPDLFALRVTELLFADALQRVRRDIDALPKEIA